MGMCTQLLFSGATRSFIYFILFFVKGVATRTLAVRGVCPDSIACRQAGMRFANNEFKGSRLVWLQIKPFILGKSIFGF